MSFKELGMRIKQERMRLHLTQFQLAEEIDISDTYMGAIERGERNLTIDKLVRIANRLGVSVDYLLGDYVAGNDDAVVDQFRQLMDKRSLGVKHMALDILKVVLSHIDKGDLR